MNIYTCTDRVKLQFWYIGAIQGTLLKKPQLDDDIQPSIETIIYFVCNKSIIIIQGTTTWVNDD